MPNAGAFAATARPMRPCPMIPSCLPRSSVPSMKSSAQPFHAPRRRSRSPSPTRLARRQDQPPCELGDRPGQHVRRVRHDDAPALRGGDVDVLVADRDVGDDLHPVAGRQHVVDAVGQQANERMLAGHAPLQLVVGITQAPSCRSISCAASASVARNRRGNAAGQEDGHRSPAARRPVERGRGSRERRRPARADPSSTVLLGRAPRGAVHARDPPAASRGRQ
jgi:hypothetical protein